MQNFNHFLRLNLGETTVFVPEMVVFSALFNRKVRGRDIFAAVAEFYFLLPGSQKATRALLPGCSRGKRRTDNLADNFAILNDYRVEESGTEMSGLSVNSGGKIQLSQQDRRKWQELRYERSSWGKRWIDSTDNVAISKEHKLKQKVALNNRRDALGTKLKNSTRMFWRAIVEVSGTLRSFEFFDKTLIHIKKSFSRINNISLTFIN